MAEQGGTPGGRRGSRRNVAAAGRSARWRIAAVASRHLAAVHRDLAAVGARGSRRGAGCCPGCRSRSAPASRSISPPITSRCCRSRPITAIALCVAAFLLRRHKAFPIAVMIAAVAAGFAIATWKTARIAHGVLARPMFSAGADRSSNTRHPRTHRPLCAARGDGGERARNHKTRRVRRRVKKGTAPDVGAVLSNSKRGCCRRCRHSGPAATISAATCSLPASAPPAS